MLTTRYSAMALLRCLTIVSLLLSIVPPSTYTQAALTTVRDKQKYGSAEASSASGTKQPDS